MVNGTLTSLPPHSHQVLNVDEASHGSVAENAVGSKHPCFKLMVQDFGGSHSTKSSFQVYQLLMWKLHVAETTSLLFKTDLIFTSPSNKQTYILYSQCSTPTVLPYLRFLSICGSKSMSSTHKGACSKYYWKVSAYKRTLQIQTNQLFKGWPYIKCITLVYCSKVVQTEHSWE